MSPWLKWMRTTLFSSLVMDSMLSRLITLSPTRSNLLMVHLLPPKSRAETPRRIAPTLVVLVAACPIETEQSEGSEPTRTRSSDPMIEAGGAEHERVVEYCSRSCARPTGCKHGRTIRGPVQRRRGAKRRPRRGGKSEKRGEGQYKGRSPVGPRPANGDGQDRAHALGWGVLRPPQPT